MLTLGQDISTRSLHELPNSASGNVCRQTDGLPEGRLLTYADPIEASQAAVIASLWTPFPSVAVSPTLCAPRPSSYYFFQHAMVQRLQQRLAVLAVQINGLQEELANTSTQPTAFVSYQCHVAHPGGEAPTSLDMLRRDLEPIDWLRAGAVLHKLNTYAQKHEYRKVVRALVVRFKAASNRISGQLRRCHGVVITERKWYIYHGQHPPRFLNKAFEGLLSSFLWRVCSSPSTASQHCV